MKNQVTTITLNVETNEYNVSVGNTIVAVISKRYRVNWLDKSMRKNTIVVEEVNAFIADEQADDFSALYDDGFCCY